MIRIAASVPIASTQQLLFVIRSADMTLTSDIPFVRQGGFSLYVPENIIAVRKTGAFGTACAGGIYTGSGKTGTQMVAAAQSYAALTGANTCVNCTIAATSTAFGSTPLLSLTTGNTGSLTADIFIFGCIVD